MRHRRILRRYAGKSLCGFIFVVSNLKPSTERTNRMGNFM
jgi:hypothetical protein